MLSVVFNPFPHFFPSYFFSVHKYSGSVYFSSEPSCSYKSKDKKKQKKDDKDIDEQARKDMQKEQQKQTQQVQQDKKKEQKKDDKKQTEKEKPQPAPSEQELKQRLDKQVEEQWLRRIPDDPGGLLRNKFRYQYSRQQPSTQEKEPW